jgi:hypothetical protein
MIVICNYSIFIVKVTVETDDKLKSSNLFAFLQLYIALPKTEYGCMSKLECLLLYATSTLVYFFRSRLEHTRVESHKR